MTVNEVDIVFISSTNESARREADVFVKTLKSVGEPCTVSYRTPFKVTVNRRHIYFMGRVTFDKWCRGRTYIVDGVLCHSGYPVQIEAREE